MQKFILYGRCSWPIQQLLPLCLSPTQKVENVVLDIPASFAASACLVTRSWQIRSKGKPVGVLLQNSFLDKGVGPMKKTLFAFVFFALLSGLWGLILEAVAAILKHHQLFEEGRVEW